MARTLLVLEVAVVGGMLLFAVTGSFAIAVLAFWAVRISWSLASPVYMTWVNGNISESAR
jgi:hypothetical protein